MSSNQTVKKMPHNRIRGRLGAETVVTLFGILFAVVFLVPFVIMVLGSFAETTVMSRSVFFWVPKSISFHNYTTLFMRRAFIGWVFNSVLYTIIPTVATIVTSLLLGYIFAKRQFRGREVIFWLFLSMLMVPSQVLAVPRYILFSQLDLIDTYGVMLVPFIWDISSLFFIRQYMQGIPNEIEEAAIIDGCGQFGVVFRIIAPMCGPALASIAILRFVAHWNDFFYPLIFLTSEWKYSLTVGLSSIMAESPPFSLTMAGAVISFLPTFLIFIFMQKYFIEGVSTSGLKG